MDDGFDVPIFHHGGKFERDINGDRYYVDGKMERFKALDVDLVFKKALEKLAKDLGYMKLNDMWWHEHTSINFEAGLHKLIGDKEINEMCEYTLNNHLKEFHIYLDHPVDVPLMPEPDQEPEPGADHMPEPIVVDSSSSDSYESVKDEAYKPPPPGYETVSSEGSSPKKSKKKKKKKRFNGKRKKKHVLSGERPSSGSGFGS
ncbi:hypothetical protein PIB30_015605 [Stylosanthes scabra]|uniref:PB1-like domain-containing protein n=1 Tax=Stylosanthes scabra TaxID=79078 RepID=A0ABU6R7C6_9FABA|nr:hypothetical protein [Stylosanthes scabra]